MFNKLKRKAVIFMSLLSVMGALPINVNAASTDFCSEKIVRVVPSSDGRYKNMYCYTAYYNGEVVVFKEPHLCYSQNVRTGVVTIKCPYNNAVEVR